MKNDEAGKQETAVSEEKPGQAEVKAETKAVSARKGGAGKTPVTQPEERTGQPGGPWVYVGPRDPRKQLRPKTAYLQIPEGVDKNLFVQLDDYPAWEKQQKEAGK